MPPWQTRDRLRLAFTQDRDGGREAPLADLEVRLHALAGSPYHPHSKRMRPPMRISRFCARDHLFAPFAKQNTQIIHWTKM